jgi:fucose 4-O-acetylase-like acetyltransferase
MPLFFFLSGLFFYDSLLKRGCRGLIVNKIDSIAYPYIVWSLLQGSIEVFTSRWTNGDATISEVLSLLWKPRMHFWFLYALFFVIIAGILVYRKAERKHFLLIAIVSSVPYIYLQAINTFGILVIGYIFGNFCFFALGIFFKEIQDYVYNSRYKLLIPSFAIFVGAQYLFHGIYGLNYIIGGAPVLALAIVSIIFTVILCMCMEYKEIKILSLIGSSSMIIYLAHILASSSVRIVLTNVFHVRDFYPNIFLGCITGIFLPIIAFKLASRMGLKFIFAVPERLSIERLYNNSINRTRKS